MTFPKHPYQAIPEPLPPPPLTSAGAFCLTVDGKWIPYLLAVAKTLAIERTWLSDSQRVTDEARNLISAIMGAKPCETPAEGGTEVEDCMGCCIRIFEGKLQTFNCGVWTTIEGGDLTALAAGAPQPAQGAPQPEPGGCEQFIGKVFFYGRWLLPVPVSTNDVITVTNALGATTDYLVDLGVWRCGDGNVFFAGGCVNATETFNAGDPAPAFHHGNLIAFDGTNYYDCGPAANSLTATITIPAGISDANLQFLINSEGPAGAGDMSFDVRICKSAALPLLLTYNLGSGPTAVNAGDVFTVSSACCGGGGGSDYGINLQFSETIQMEILNQTGYTPSWAGSQIWMFGQQPVGTPVQVHTDTSAGRTPTEWNPATSIDLWNVEEGNGGVPFTVQMRLSR
jgi:hypothetical protein